MKTKRLKENPKDIEELREQIEEWRRKREKRTGMPEELWQAAVSLLDKYTLSQVSSRWNIGWDGLQQVTKILGVFGCHGGIAVVKNKLDTACLCGHTLTGKIVQQGAVRWVWVAGNFGLS